MEKIIVYLGSDHVIHHPTFGIRENTLNMATTREAAIAKARHKDSTVVLSSYYLDLDALHVKAPKQLVMDGFDSYDVIIHDSQQSSMISLCSEAALKSLEFASASFA